MYVYVHTNTYTYTHVDRQTEKNSCESRQTYIYIMCDISRVCMHIYKPLTLSLPHTHHIHHSSHYIHILPREIFQAILWRHHSFIPNIVLSTVRFPPFIVSPHSMFLYFPSLYIHSPCFVNSPTRWLFLTKRSLWYSPYIYFHIHSSPRRPKHTPYHPPYNFPPLISPHHMPLFTIPFNLSGLSNSPQDQTNTITFTIHLLDFHGFPSSYLASFPLTMLFPLSLRKEKH